MKAILLQAYGGLDQLELADVPAPEPGRGQICVRVISASINPIDWKLRSGAAKGRMPLELPAILGRDVAGVVTKLGAEVSSFRVGDPVLGLTMGGYAELAIGAVEAWAPVPEGLSLEDAGALPLALLTGDQLAEAALGAGAAAGKTVLVTGALGSVGRAAVWGARARAATVVAGVRRSQLDSAKALGANAVAIDEDDAVAALEPFDAIADTVGGPTIARLLPRVKPGGTIGSVLGEPPGARERGLTVRALMARPDAKRLGELARDVADGKLVIPIARRFPLAEARAAQELAERGGIGKVLLMP
jgi:NADPH:quinone reductase-like Zn-dependent oxidoreductase